MRLSVRYCSPSFFFFEQPQMMYMLSFLDSVRNQIIKQISNLSFYFLLRLFHRFYTDRRQ